MTKIDVTHNPQPTTMSSYTRTPTPGPTCQMPSKRFDKIQITKASLVTYSHKDTSRKAHPLMWL